MGGGFSDPPHTIVKFLSKTTRRGLTPPLVGASKCIFNSGALSPLCPLSPPSVATMPRKPAPTPDSLHVDMFLRGLRERIEDDVLLTLPTDSHLTDDQIGALVDERFAQEVLPILKDIVPAATKI